MSDVTRDRDPVTWNGLDAALQEAEVLVEEYAGYDEGAARRRIARRIVADRARAAIGTEEGVVPGARSAGSDDLVLDATCHVRAARALDEIAWVLAESRAFAELALGADTWPHGADSALLFGCLLHLNDEEGAQFWFQYAAGAGSRTAARCLYLHHLARAEVRTARHWKRQARALPPDEHLPPLPEIPETIEEALRASIIWTSPPITTQDLAALSAAGPFVRPPYRLPPRLRRAVTTRVWSDDPDLGSVPIPGPQVAAAVAQHARLNPLHLTDAAHAWALEVLKEPHPVRPARSSPGRRPAPAAMESVHRALRVLEIINRYSGGVSLTQIARETALPQLALARAVEQLHRAALASPVGPDAYVAGSALRLTQCEDGRAHLQETLAWVRDAVGAAVYVARYTDGEVSITQYADGPATPLVEEWVDFRAAAHASAVGKALLTQLDDEERKDHLARHRLTRFTAHTLSTPQALFHQLDSRRPSAPLLDLEEYAVGTVCAAVPITAGPNAECVALSIPATDPLRLQQAARILQSEAAAVLIALIVAGSAQPTARRNAAREGGATGPAGLGSSLLSPTA